MNKLGRFSLHVGVSSFVVSISLVVASAFSSVVLDRMSPEIFAVVAMSGFIIGGGALCIAFWAMHIGTPAGNPPRVVVQKDPEELEVVPEPLGRSNVHDIGAQRFIRNMFRNNK